MNRLIAIVAVGLSVSALAQNETSNRKSVIPQRAPVVQKVDFTDDLVTGDRETPLDEFYAVPTRPGFKSLIQVRQNFNDKLRDSVHEM